MANKIGTRIVVHRHRNGVINSTTVAVSAELPYPSVITQLVISSNAAGGDSSPAFFDLYLSDDSGTGNAPITGTKLTDHVLAGSVNPDVTGDDPLALPIFHSASETNMPAIDVWIPVPKNGMRLKTVVHQITAATSVNVIVAVCTLYDGPTFDASTAIIPRGTPEEPVCVKICGAAPPIEQPPIAPPPGPPPPPAPSGPDILAEPLPPPCDISVEAPLTSASATCDNTAA